MSLNDFDERHVLPDTAYTRIPRVSLRYMRKLAKILRIEDLHSDNVLPCLQAICDVKLKWKVLPTIQSDNSPVDSDNRLVIDRAEPEKLAVLRVGGRR